ncbi:MAG: periplasmic chaperone Skp [Sodalis sp. Fse]|nr:MAG: periplasmic chaperone Skp [Sodalis sp. Fse]
MKKWLYAAVLSLVQPSPTSALAADKIAVVNVSNIFEQSPQTAIVAKELENEFKDRATELQSIKRDLQTKMQRLQLAGPSMKDNERSALEKLVMTQREDFSKKAQAFEQDNHRRQTEERNKILSRIQDAVRNIASKEGYDVVIDANAVAYASNAKDITDDVVKQVK